MAPRDHVDRADGKSAQRRRARDEVSLIVDLPLARPQKMLHIPA
jgi:hypothetical protein